MFKCEQSLSKFGHLRVQVQIVWPVLPDHNYVEQEFDGSMPER